jgi:Zinc knuckle
MDPANDMAIDTLKNKVRGQYLATAFVLGSPPTRFGRLIEDMQTCFYKVSTTTPPPIQLLTITLPTGTKAESFNTNGIDESSNFSQSGKRDKVTISCFKCKNLGHYASECEEKENESGTIPLMNAFISGENDDCETTFQFIQLEEEVSMHTNDESWMVPRLWIFLDNQSTSDLFYIQIS